MMQIRYLIATAALAVALAAPAGAKELKQVGFIDVPGDKPLDGYDISYVDQKADRLYLADRTNKAIDVFDGKTEKFLFRVGGFTGTRPNDTGGPNGVVASGDEAWAGDGDSTLKFMDLK